MLQGSEKTNRDSDSPSSANGLGCPELGPFSMSNIQPCTELCVPLVRGTVPRRRTLLNPEGSAQTPSTASSPGLWAVQTVSWSIENKLLVTKEERW